MREFNAYCVKCHVVVLGQAEFISEPLDSGNYLYVGHCPICNNEIRRIVTKANHMIYPEPWYRHTPKGADIWATQTSFEE